MKDFYDVQMKLIFKINMIPINKYYHVIISTFYLSTIFKKMYNVKTIKKNVIGLCVYCELLNVVKFLRI